MTTRVLLGVIIQLAQLHKSHTHTDLLQESLIGYRGHQNCLVVELLIRRWIQNPGRRGFRGAKCLQLVLLMVHVFGQVGEDTRLTRPLNKLSGKQPFCYKTLGKREAKGWEKEMFCTRSVCKVQNGECSPSIVCPSDIKVDGCFCQTRPDKQYIQLLQSGKFQTDQTSSSSVNVIFCVFVCP